MDGTHNFYVEELNNLNMQISNAEKIIIENQKRMHFAEKIRKIFLKISAVGALFFVGSFLIEFPNLLSVLSLFSFGVFITSASYANMYSNKINKDLKMFQNQRNYYINRYNIVNDLLKKIDLDKEKNSDNIQNSMSAIEDVHYLDEKDNSHPKSRSRILKY